MFFFLAQSQVAPTNYPTPLWALAPLALVLIGFVWVVVSSQKAEMPLALPVLLPDLEAEPLWPLHIEKELRSFAAMTPAQPEVDDLIDGWRAWMEWHSFETRIEQQAAWTRVLSKRRGNGDLSLSAPVVQRLRAM